MIIGAGGAGAEVQTLEHQLETMLGAFASEAWEKVKADLAAKMQSPTSGRSPSATKF